MRRSINIVIVGLAMIAGQTAGQESVDTVSLRFNWPAGLTGRVVQEIFRSDSSARKHDSTVFTYSHRLRVLEHPRGLLVRYDSMVVPGLDEVAKDAASAFAQQLLRNITSLTPSYVVNREGEFLEVAEIKRLHAAMDSLFAPMLEEIEQESAQARSLIQGLMSEQVLTNSAAEAWNAMVGTWVGADWEVGAAYEYESEAPSPIMPGVMIPFHYEFGAVERVPCREGGEEDECVHLVMVSTPDMDATREVLKKFVEQLAGEKDMGEFVAAIETMQLENVVTVITNPQTLVPYHVATERHIRLTTPAIDAESPAGENYRYERHVQTFHWER
jgi:hypothetical protein